MNVHKHARLTPSGRALLVQRTFQGLGIEEVAQAAGVSVRTAYKWLKRFREEGIRPDRSLVTPKHLTKLRPSEKKPRKPKAVLRDDGSQAVIDLLLGREVPAYAKTRREYLVVELKRPSQKIDLAMKSQIESYAMAVAADEA